MRRFTPLLLLVGLLAACGVADQPSPAAQPTSIPAVPLASPIAPVARGASPTVTALPAPTTVSSPRPLAEIALENVLFQPGDLALDVQAGALETTPDELGGKMLVPPQRFGALRLQFSSSQDSIGDVSAAFYESADDRARMYQASLPQSDNWIRKIQVAVPTLGDQAMLSMPTMDDSTATLILVRCRAIVTIRLFAVNEREAIETYAERVAQRLDAVDCQGQSSAPMLPPAPPTRADGLLFQPGDLPDGFTAGEVHSAATNTAKMDGGMALPDSTMERGFRQNGNPDSAGFVSVYHYAEAPAALAMYTWLQSWADSQRPNVALPDIGDQARLYVPVSSSDDWALFFLTCRAAVEIRMGQAVDRAVVLNYAQRLARRLVAAECESAPQPASSPASESPPLAARVTGAISATVVRLPDPGGDQFIRAYTFADADHGWLAHGASILATSDGGATWHEQTVADAPVKAIRFASARRGWVITERGVIETEDGGTTWSDASAPPEPAADVFQPPERDDWKTYAFCDEESSIGTAFAAVDARVGWAVCRGPWEAHDDTHKLFRTDDGGKTWRLLGTNQCSALLGQLVFLDREHGWAAGKGGVCITDDGGKTWRGSLDVDPLEGYATDPLPLSPTSAFALAHDSQNEDLRETLVRTDDGGKTWRALFKAMPAPWPGLPIQFFADGSAISKAGRLAGDGSWLPNSAIAYPACGPYALDMGDISFAGPLHGWEAITCGRRPQPVLLHTEDGGATWAPAPAVPGDRDDPITGVTRVDERTGYVVSEKGLLYRTDDNGTTWQATDGRRAHAANVQFATPSEGWEVRGDQLFATVDGGQTWQQIELGVPIWAASLLGNGHGWVLSGAPVNGQSNVYFGTLLETADGGQTWRAVQFGPLSRETWVEPSMLIQFADTSHGWLYSGGALFATADGGQRWTQTR